MRQPTAKSFLKDVAEHKMTIHLEQGVYRSILFQKPQNSNMWFELVTWPGVLTIHGDMGTWTFSRVQDMFTFFRDDKLRINPSYWSEKLRHGNFGGSDGAKVWDQDTFKSRLLANLDTYFDGEPEALSAVKSDVEEQIFRYHDGDGAHMVRHAAYEFTYKFENGDKFQFEAMDLPDGMIYSYHFIWCLYAIVWGIQQWDKQKDGV